MVVGIAMAHDLVGRGYGRSFLSAILELGQSHYQATAFAATVAAFNGRALALCRSLGFIDLRRFTSRGEAPREFVILRREA